jgi:adenine/guanine phosphoribosyltransferase-like PRPP-binding protein
VSGRLPPAHDDAFLEAVRNPGVAHIVGRARGQIANPLDGRYGAFYPRLLQALIRRLVAMVDLDEIDAVLGIPEGGLVPAYAFAAEAGLPLVLATSSEPEMPGIITFKEDHVEAFEGTKRVYGLSAGQVVLIVEDEITTGNTIVNCVRALRNAGVHIDQVASVLAVDDPEALARLEAEGLTVHVAEWLPPDLTHRLDRIT